MATVTDTLTTAMAGLNQMSTNLLGVAAFDNPDACLWHESTAGESL